MNERKRGKVWLVGAGPSDPGLFTLKGKQVLEEAEVVVYDALVGPSVLQMIPGTAEAIHVGKRSGSHTMPQEKISELLAEKAREGKRVVRLKGGDPFLFGRGGEELERLTGEQIPYEVVPGITSAFAVPAYQGIPVTHRDYCSSVHIITGHKRAGQSLDIDFEALARTGGTLVFLMGTAALGDICRGLLAAGMKPETPAALLMQGTTAAQERIVATVETLEAEAARRGTKTPAIIVVGGVCALAEKFSWYQKLPLGGVRVLLTRPRESAGETAGRLRRLGAEVLEVPAIRTVRRKENERLQQALDKLDCYQWLAFTSPAGVCIFFEELRERRMDVRRLGGLRLAVIGEGSERELEKYGLYADLMPEVYDGEHLGKALREACKPGDHILIPRSAIGNQELTDALLGAERDGLRENPKHLQVDDIATYDTLYEASRVIDERELLEQGGIDYALFTSASAVRGFAAAVEGLDFTKVKAVCIGRQTKAAADALGMQTWMSSKATTDSLIGKLIELCGV